MFLNLFYELKQARVPVSVKEYLTLLEAMDRNVAALKVEDFYYLARTCLVKDERHLDRFDVVFGKVFKGLSFVSEVEGIEAQIPAEWLQKLAEKFLTDEEKAQIEALGGWDKLMETLRQRLAEQKGRHQGGSKWIGTAGTSPFGAHGYNPEGVRIGQDESRHRRAVKVWDKREFRNLDDSLVIGTRNIQLALRRLRKFAREGAPEKLDLPGTIRSTAQNAGWLDLQMMAERRNTVKVLLLLDIGGSMDDFIKISAELFSAARSEFKHIEHIYFHNCPYESVWKDNRRRNSERTPTLDLIRTYGRDWKLIFVGDASMSPYEIAVPGGSVEHWNEEAGQVWMQRLTDHFEHVAWLNPVREDYWGHTQSIQMMKQLVDDRMYPLTLAGLDRAMRELNL